METKGAQPKSAQGVNRVQIIVASAAGNFAEWFDFGLYGVLATVLASHFFPKGDPTVALLSTYAIFALTYLTRPLGGLVAGWLGDTLGRRTALFVTVTLMSVATGAIGLLPTYASIGIFAPALLLLCRLVQGLGAGGEYGSAVTFLAEHSSPKQRATNVGYLVASTFLGVLVAVGAASLCTALMGDALFNAWGWRILFLLAVPLGLAGVYIRRQVAETPEFVEMASNRARSHEAATPIRTALRTQWSTMVLFVLVVSAYALITPTLSSFFITFLKGPGGLSAGDAYGITLLVDVLLIVAALAAGPLMSRFGMYRLLLGGSLFVAITAVPAFALAATGYWGAVLGGALLAVGKGMLAVPVALSISQMFPARVRITAGSLAYNICVVIFGASGPLLGVWLSEKAGTGLAFSLYLAVIAGIAAIATFVGRNRIKVQHEDAVEAASSGRGDMVKLS
ncbi:MFS transporter [Pseudarthrobacter sp. P1]|uniref:MFS transporter n=1 Tax=Pseudarthrobacter sp. P1 TaxID=3418418 RepID=UPI003CF5E731